MDTLDPQAFLVSSSGIPSAYWNRLRTGDVLFDRYVVQSRLGTGAFGIVYKCLDTGMSNLPVAVKVFPASIAREESAAARLHREIRSAFTIDHNNVARFYDCLRDDIVIAIIMEFVIGETLESIQKRKGKLSAELVAMYMLQTAQGLDAIHSAGIVHRDLKPANILITNEGFVKITDFGLARSFDGIEDGRTLTARTVSTLSGAANATHDSQVVGTPQYLTPEYILNGTIDQTMDIYALGLVGYTLAAGRTPWETKDVNELFKEKVQSVPAQLSQFNAALPEYLTSLIMDSISPDITDRPQNIDSVIQRLQEGKVATPLYLQAAFCSEQSSAESEVEPLVGWYDSSASRRPLIILSFLCLLGALTILAILQQQDSSVTRGFVKLHQVLTAGSNKRVRVIGPRINAARTPVLQEMDTE